MKKISRTQLASISAAAVLAGYVVIASALQGNQADQELDLPALMAADAAAVDYFLKLEGIGGESTDEGHRGEIEIMSYSWGASNSGSFASGSGGGAGKVNFGSLRLTTAGVSIASPSLFDVVATGKHLPTATLTLVKQDGGYDYLKVTLSDVVISSYQTAGSAGEVPIESIRLNFAKIEYEYTPQNPDGSLGDTAKAGWDLAANKRL